MSAASQSDGSTVHRQVAGSQAATAVMVAVVASLPLMPSDGRYRFGRQAGEGCLIHVRGKWQVASRGNWTTGKSLSVLLICAGAA